jgi:pimeloyl-ACP methyl ester carboxylesterase
MAAEARWANFVTFPGPDRRMLSYSRRGIGSLLVCVPGGPGLDPEAYFHGFEVPGVELLIFAPRGTALSTAPETNGGYRLAGYVEDLEHLRSHLGVDRLTLYGNSYGGTIALAYASAHPNRVERLIVSNAAAIVDEAYERATDRARGRFVAHIRDAAQRLAAADKAKAAAETDSSEQTQNRAFRASMACGVANEGPVEAAYLDQLCAAPDNRDAQDEMWVEWRGGLNLFDQLSSVTAMTLLIAGEFDIVVPPELVEPIAAAIANARYVEIPNAGHFVAIEATDQFQAMVSEFLSSGASAAA